MLFTVRELLRFVVPSTIKSPVKVVKLPLLTDKVLFKFVAPSTVKIPDNKLGLPEFTIKESNKLVDFVAINSL